MSKPVRKYMVATTTRFGARRIVYLKRSGRYTLRAKRGRARMTYPEAAKAVRWYTEKGHKDVRAYGRGKWWMTHVRKGSTEWPTDKKLLRRLGRVGRKCRRWVHIVSGLRTDYEAWVLRMRYLQGRGALAAQCCTRYTGIHTWESCGKNPQSNHASGNAADCGIIKRTGAYVSIWDYKRARKWITRFRLALTVRWSNGTIREPWHVERSDR